MCLPVTYQLLTKDSQQSAAGFCRPVAGLIHSGRDQVNKIVDDSVTLLTRLNDRLAKGRFCEFSRIASRVPRLDAACPGISRCTIK